MKNWPEFDNNGDLPIGIHRTTLDEFLQHFGTSTVQRLLVGQRLKRIYKLADSIRKVAKLSCLALSSQPIRILLIEDSFDANQVQGRGNSESMRAYLAFMAPRPAEIWRLLKPTSSVYLHCAPHA